MLHYSKKHTPCLGKYCMVFPDKEKENPHKGSRYFYGIVRYVSNGMIRVEVTETSWSEFEKGDYWVFEDFQVWPEKSAKQLTLFQ